MADRSHTPFPRSHPSMPYFAPIMGAMPLPGAGAAAAGPDLAQPIVPGAASLDPMPLPDGMQPVLEVEALPEVGIGLATSAISGAVTGAVASGDARGAATGAAFTLGMWSGFTAVGSWRELGPRSRFILLAGALSGVGVAAGLYLTRRRA